MSDVIVELVVGHEAFETLFEVDPAELEIDEYREMKHQDNVFIRFYPEA